MTMGTVIVKIVDKLAVIGRNTLVVATGLLVAIVLFGFVFPWLVSAKSGVAVATGVCLLIFFGVFLFLSFFAEN